MIEPRYIYDDPIIAREAITGFTPNDFDTFTYSIRQGFNEMWLTQGFNWLKYHDFDITGSRESPTILEDNWNEEHPSYREGLNYRDMTEFQADLLAKNYDKQLFYQTWFQNVGAWDGYRIGGFLVGSLPDPINLIPLGGGIVHLTKVGNIARKSLNLSAKNLALAPIKMAGTLTKEGFETAGLAGLASVAIYSNKNLYQEEYGVSDIGVDMAFAFGAGFALGNFARAKRTWDSWSPGKKQGEIIKTATDANGDTTSPLDPSMRSDDPNLEASNTPKTKDPDFDSTKKLKEINEQAEINAKADDVPEPELEATPLWKNWRDSIVKDQTVIEIFDSLGDIADDVLDFARSCVKNVGKQL